MRLQKVQAPTGDPLTLEEAKLFLRVTQDREDDLIMELVAAATRRFEAYTGRQVITARWRLFRSAFPARGRSLEIPRPPLQSVSAVQYLDPSGTLQTWPTSAYRVSTFSGDLAPPGLIVPAPGEEWPETAPGDPAAVQVQFTAGYGAASSTPAAVKQAVRQILGGYYEHRESEDPVRMYRNPGLDALLADFVVSAA